VSNFTKKTKAFSGIRGKMLFVILSTCAVSLFLFAIIAGSYQIRTQKDVILQDISLNTKLLAQDLIGAMAFDDISRIKTTLKNLSLKETEIDVCVFNAEHDVIASFSQSSSFKCDITQLDDSKENSNRIRIIEEIRQKESIYGYISITSHMTQYKAIVVRHIFLFSFIVILIVFVFSFPMADWMQRSISQPIYTIVDRTKEVRLLEDLQGKQGIESGNELQVILDFINEIQPYISIVEKSGDVKIAISKAYVNKGLLFSLINESHSISQKTTEIALNMMKSGEFGKVDENYIQLSSVSAESSKELVHLLGVLGNIVAREEKILRKGRKFIAPDKSILKVYESIFGKFYNDKIELRLSNKIQHKYLYLYEEAFEAFNENIFSIFIKVMDISFNHLIEVSAYHKNTEMKENIIIEYSLRYNDSKFVETVPPIDFDPNMIERNLIAAKFFYNINGIENLAEGLKISFSDTEIVIASNFSVPGEIA
jgi:uncharacterized membrane protein affecting hemolysin expression